MSPSDMEPSKIAGERSICSTRQEKKESLEKMKNISADNTSSSFLPISYNNMDSESTYKQVKEQDKLISREKSFEDTTHGSMKEDISDDAGENDILVRAKRNLRKVNRNIIHRNDNKNTKQTEQDFSTADANKNKKKESTDENPQEGKRIPPPKNVQPVISGIIILEINLSSTLVRL